ncbi:MAG: Do family serine endopeptidase [Sedimentisphaerales bacterium]|nr:Do family serine endopeptidase [Sedimentisphaerales bacterium]
MLLTSSGKSKKQLSIIAVSTILILLTYTTVSFSNDQDSINAVRQMGKAFSSIAQKTSPAVVGIKTERVLTRENLQSRFGNEFYEYFFRGPQRRPRGQQQQPNREPELPTSETQGSGFIISSDGYILTNNHMVESTSKINIELTNGQTFVANVVGSDPDSDIAVIKIDANNLPYLEFADSDTLEVGEWVLAIGNPLGLAHTVTAGIVSATGRTGFELNTLENYIQTDAAINFGNSGGPLINLDGKVVGINTAIAGSSGNIGIGFAIPINMAKYSYKEILASGTVERGLLGIRGLQTLTPDSAPIYGLDKNAKGVTFSEVIKNSAADKAGLTHKDVIIEIDGKPVETFLDLQTRISMLKPDTKVTLTIWRDNKRDKLDVALGKRSEAEQLQSRAQIESVENILGFKFEDVNETTAQKYGYEGQTGVVVIEIDSNSEARKSGIVEGTLIKEVNHQTVRNTKEFIQAVENARGNETGNILLWGNIKGTDYNFLIKLP